MADPRNAPAPIPLDWSRLLGFDQFARCAEPDRRTAPDCAKVGVKTERPLLAPGCAKVGLKPGKTALPPNCAKVGRKL
jgi:hypothetical protein